MVHQNYEIDVAVENLNLRRYAVDDEDEDGKCHS